MASSHGFIVTGGLPDHGPDRIAGNVDEQAQIIVGDGEYRHQYDDIAQRSNPHTVSTRFLTDLEPGAFAVWLHLDTRHRSDPTDLAYSLYLEQWLQPFTHQLTHPIRVRDRVVRGHQIEVGDGGCGAERIRGVGVAVEEGASALRSTEERVIYVVGGQYR